MTYSRGDLASLAGEAAYGAFYLFSGQTLATLIAALASIVVARLLGPELYGLYSLCLVVPGFLLLFTDFGVSPALTRFSAKLRAEGEYGRLASLIRSGFIFKVFTCFTTLLIGLTLSDILAALIINRFELAFLVRVAVFLALFNGVYVTVNSTLIGFNDMKSSASLSVVVQLARSVLCPILIVAGFSVLGALIGFVLSYLLAALLGTVIVFNHYRRLNPRVNNAFSGDLRAMLSYGLPLYLSSTLESAAGSYQGMVLAWLTSNVMIGNFRAAANLASLMNLLTGPISTALFPAFSRLSLNGGGIRWMVKYSVKYTAAILAPASIFVIVMSRDLVSIIYGQAYNTAPDLLSLYSIVFLYAGLGSVVWGSFFQGVGWTKVNLKAPLIYSTLLTPLTLILAKSYSVPGLIVGFLASSLASTIYSLSVALRRLHISIDVRSTITIYFASAISATPLLLLVTYSRLPSPINLALGLAVFTILYLTLMPIIGGINQEDIENFKLMFKEVKPLKPIINVILNYEAKLARSKF